MENNNRQGCRWVKASERLPEKEGQYYVLMDNWKGTAYFNGNRFETGDWIKIERIQWLDESLIEPCDDLFEQFKEHILTGDCTWEELKLKYKIYGRF